MPDKSLEDVLEAAEIMVEAEKAVAKFYTACSEVFSSSERFWGGLAEEEIIHAEAIAKLAQLIRKKPYRFEPGDLLPLADLRGFVAKIYEKVGDVREGFLKEPGALLLAYQIENTVIESKYPEVVLTDDPNYAQILSNLVLRTRRHREMVRDRLKRSETTRLSTESGPRSGEIDEEETAALKSIADREDTGPEEDQPAPKPEAFSGQVEGVDILEYVQFILFTGKNTVLQIHGNDGVSCTLYLKDSTVVHAMTRDMEGEEAFYRCMGFRGGEFAHRPWEEPDKTTIEKPSEFLLFEAARRRDEKN